MLTEHALVTTSAASGVRALSPEVTIFRGHALGLSPSLLVMAVGADGISAFLDVSGRRYAIVPDAHSESTLEAGDHLILDADEVADRPGGPQCDSDDSSAPEGVLNLPRLTAESTVPPAGRLTCEVAIECDYEFYATLFAGNATRATEYVLMLMATISAIYERDLNVELQIPYLNIWTTADPYVGTTTSTALSEFRSYWNANRTGVPRRVAHLLSGRPLGGGRAYLNVLCSSSDGYGVSQVNGTGVFPNNIPTADAFIVAHEIGHNFGSYHTQDCWWQANGYTPPGALLDSCVTAEGGSCYGGPINRIPWNRGTLMSYCQGVYSGRGTANVRLDFHAACATVMRTVADASCLPLVATEPPLLSEATFGGGGAHLEWAASPTAGVDGYRVYRSRYMLDSGSSYVGSTGGTTYFDATCPDEGASYYKLRALLTGDSSSFSNELRVDPGVAWSPDGIPIAAGSGIQGDPTAIQGDAGTFLLVWGESLSEGNIFAQRITERGYKLWQESDVPVCTAANSQYRPASVSDGAGGAIVVWEDDRSSSLGDLYAQRVNGAGAALWTANGVPICTAANKQINKRIVSDGAGGAIVVWEDYRTSPTRIYAQRVNSVGTRLWASNGISLSAAANNKLQPTLVEDGAGGAIVVWTDYRTDRDIYAQRINGAGSPLWASNGIPVCTASFTQWNPLIVSDGAGGAIVVWEDDRTPSSLADLYAQRVNGAGAALWTANGVPICVAPGFQSNASAVVDNESGVVVAWNDTRGPDGKVFAGRLDASGAPAWQVDGFSVCAAPGRQDYPKVVGNGSLGFVIVWQDYRAPSRDIYGQHLAPDGALRGPADGLPICSEGSYQADPAAVRVGTDSVVVYWMDYRSPEFGYGDVFATLATQPSTVAVPLAPPQLVLDGPIRISLNPAYGPVDLDLELSARRFVQVSIHDIGGRLVSVPLAGDLAAGSHRVRWDSRSRDGALAPPGVYFVELRLDGRRRGTGRIVVLR